jgi:hypothetical protein
VSVVYLLYSNMTCNSIQMLVPRTRNSRPDGLRKLCGRILVFLRKGAQIGLENQHMRSCLILDRDRMHRAAGSATRKRKTEQDARACSVGFAACN